MFNRIKSFFYGNSGSFISSWHKPSPWTDEQLLHQYKGYVYAIVSAIAEEVAKLEPVVKNQAGKELENHGFLRLLGNPNPDMSQFSLLELSQTHMELTGEFFWFLAPLERSRIPTAIYILPPDRMEVVRAEDSTGTVAGYTMTNNRGEKIPFERDEVFHCKMPNPWNPYRGLGTLEAAATYVRTEQFSSEWGMNSIYNGGAPSGLLSVKGVMDEQKFKRFKKQFREEYAGPQNAAKIAILKDMDIAYEQLGMGMDGANLAELKNMSRDDLMAVWRVHKTMLGISDDVNRANAREGRIVFLENVIEPKQWRIIDAMDSFLLDRWGKGTKLDFISPVPEDHEEKMLRYEKGHNKWLTTNDIRREEGMTEVEGGDSIYRPLNEVPAMEAKKSIKKKFVIKRKVRERKELTREQKNEIFRLQLFNRQAQWEKKYQDGVQKVFDAQKNEILSNNSKSFEEWVFDKKRSKERYLAILTPITQSLMEEQGKSAIAFAGGDVDFFMTDELKEAVQERVERFADNTDQETIDKIRETMSEGFQEGDNLVKLRKRITEVYAATPERAERIARTETIYASNQATNEAYKQTGFVQGQEWLPEPDACPFCLSFKGKVVGLNSSFATEGETVTGTDGKEMEVNYGDVGHPPLHPNCKCSLVPVTDFSTVRQLEEMKKMHDEMDKRTKEAKKLQEEIENREKELKEREEKLLKEEEELDKLINEL